MNKAKFYDEIRKLLFKGNLKQKQVDGIEAILAAFAKYGDGNKRHLAYLLATAYHETWGQMQPVIETQSPRDIARPTVETAKRRLDNAFAAGKLAGVRTPYWRDGWLGRGFVQVTHKVNYENVRAMTGIDVVAAPERLFELEFSARVLVQGCLNGWWTGWKLRDFSTYREMRKVVNGTDRAEDIANYAAIFQTAIDNADPPPDVPAVVEPPEPRGWFSRFLDWLFQRRK